MLRTEHKETWTLAWNLSILCNFNINNTVNLYLTNLYFTILTFQISRYWLHTVEIKVLGYTP
jgi:hypothetical protein